MKNQRTSDEEEEMKKISQVLSEIEKKRIEICNHAASVEAEIKKRFKELLIALHDVTQLKVCRQSTKAY